jgi:Abortive infection C-terminus
VLQAIAKTLGILIAGQPDSADLRRLRNTVGALRRRASGRRADNDQVSWLIDDVIDEDEPPGIEELKTGIEQLDDMLGILSAAATGRASDQRSYLRVRHQLNQLLSRAKIKTPFRWNTLDTWTAYTKTTYRTYEDRRNHALTIVDEVRAALQKLLQEAERGNLSSELDELDKIAGELLDNPSGIRVELARLPGLLHTDLHAAVGKAKNLVEATAKAVLATRGQKAPEYDFSKTVTAALRALDLDPDPRGMSPEAQAMRLLKDLTGYVGTLRNNFGDGHGAVQAHTAVEPRHARLAVRAALTWCHFALETLHEQTID